MRAIPLLGLLVALMIAISRGDRALESPPKERISTDLNEALSADEQISQAAIERLRGRGPEAFAELLAQRDRALGSVDPRLDEEKLDAVIETVGGARYSSVSGLYWYTDLEKAAAEARRTGTPILSLRMLGRLNDEFSCANSRFFRTTLYANRQIADYLRDNFVLHWKSVRPVPRVTVDFGDGRRLERTVTGNSIHYVLSPEGEVIDGLPGLYGPAQFLAWLGEAHSLAATAAEIDDERRDFSSFLKEWHAQKARSATQRWRADVMKIGENERAAALARDRKLAAQRGKRDRAPAARKAAAFSVNKFGVERPLIQNITLMPASVESTSDDLWEKIAALHRHEVRLDEASIQLIRHENPHMAEPNRWLILWNGSEVDPISRMIDEFERNMALDTVRNEYELHRQLHEWFAEDSAPSDLEKLNEQVYAELFLTPSSDPWLGLVTDDVYTGLVNGGVVRSE